MRFTPELIHQALDRDAKNVSMWRNLGTASYDAACDSSNLDAIRLHRLAEAITKKWNDKQTTTERSALAIATFLDCNEKCRVPLQHSDLLWELKDFFNSMYQDFDWHSLLANASHGPGASVGSKGRNSPFEKFFLNRITTTDSSLYSEWCSFLHKCSSVHVDAEIRRRVMCGEHFQIVQGSNLSTVPKNVQIDRTICTEPSLNMVFQRALASLFDTELERMFGYHDSMQPLRNKEAAKRGSSFGDVATVDLKSASDSISMHLVRAVFPPVIVAAIEDCRSPYAMVDGRWTELHMVSSMGNGFTFSLMTLLLSAILFIVARREEVPFERFSAKTSRYGVFGDDIICPSELYGPLCDSLSAVGFTVNKEKSYSTGLFRESCGGDYFGGFDVRGIYLKSLDSIQEICVAVNTLNRWSARNGIPLTNLIGLLTSKLSVPSLAIPSFESDDAGIKTPSSLYAKRCYNAFEVRRSEVAVFKTSGEIKPDFDNPNGLILAAASGWLRSCRISRRQKLNRYAKTRKTSSLVWACQADLDKHGVSYETWETVCWLSLTN